MRSRLFLACFLLVALGCGSSGPTTYTLYRNSPSSPNMRIHVATFDAQESGNYNHDNAELAAKLFASQPGVTVKYWVEPGRFKATN